MLRAHTQVPPTGPTPKCPQRGPHLPPAHTHVLPPSKDHAALTWPHFELVEPGVAAACDVAVVVIVAITCQACVPVIDVDGEAHCVAPSVWVVVCEGCGVAAFQLHAGLKWKSRLGQDIGVGCREGSGGGGQRGGKEEGGNM